METRKTILPLEEILSGWDPFFSTENNSLERMSIWEIGIRIRIPEVWMSEEIFKGM